MTRTGVEDGDRLTVAEVGGRVFLRMWNSRTLTAWAAVATRGISLLLVLPLLLTRLSAPEIAVWYLIAAIISLQSLADLGFAPTFARMIAYGMGGATSLEAKSEAGAPGAPRGPNWELIGAVWHTMRRVYMRLAIVSLLLVASVGTLAMLRPMRALVDPARGWIAWTVVVAVSAVVLGGNTFSAYLQGVDEIVLVRRWDAIMGAGAILTSFVVLLAGGRLLALVLANQVWAVGVVLRDWQLARSVHEGRFRRLRPGDHASVMRVVWPSAWRSGIGVGMNRGVTQATGVVFAQLGSSAAVASYLIGLRIIQLIADLSVAPLGSNLPRWARLRAEGRREELLASAQRTMRVIYWTFAAAVIAVGVAAPRLFAALHSHAAFVEPRIWALLGVAFFIERYGAAHIQLFSTTNKIIWHVANGVTGLIVVVTSAVLLPLLGVFAFPIAFVAGNLGFYGWYSALHSYRADRIRPLAFERTTALPPFGVVAIYGAFSFIASRG